MKRIQYKGRVIPEAEEFILKAEAVALRVGGAVYVSDIQTASDGDILIFVGTNGISIKISRNDKEKPVHIDFTSGKIQHRQNNSGTRKESIARAVGLKSGQNLSILDATAGLGGDSFVLASLGANMTMLERSPLVHLLLEDALKRARSDEKLAPIIARMNLIAADSVNYLDNINIIPDVIYMDPMFPDKTKTALNKKEMRLFKEIAGKDEDIEILFAKALRVAAKRVVVKRPAKSAYVSGIKPEFSIEGKASRFDVYICKNTRILES